MNNLSQMNCDAFSEALASKVPVPGGGGASALVGALAAALCAMAGNFTIGKEKYVAVEAEVSSIVNECYRLRERFISLIEEDACAYEQVSQAYSLPKDDPLRADAIRLASLAASEPPLEMIDLSAHAVELLERMLEIGSKLLITDVGCGAAMAAAAMRSAALNVYVNTASYMSDPYARESEEHAKAVLAEWLPRAETIVNKVMACVLMEEK